MASNAEIRNSPSVEYDGYVTKRVLKRSRYIFQMIRHGNEEQTTKVRLVEQYNVSSSRSKGPYLTDRLL